MGDMALLANRYTRENSVAFSSNRSFERRCSKAVVSHIAAIFILLFAVASPLHAYQLNASGGVDIGYTDNVDLEKEKKADSFLELFTELKYHDQSATMEGDLEGRIGYREYLNGNGANEFDPDLHGNLDIRLLPDRLSWLLEGDWRQLRTSALAPDSPDNLENQAVVQTGPDLRVPLTASTELKSSIRAGYSYNSDEQDAYRFLTQVGLVTKRSPSESVSANLGLRSIRYLESDTVDVAADVAALDFDVFEAFLSYESELSRSKTTLDFGFSHSDVDDSEDVSGLLVRLDTNMRLSPLTRGGLKIRYGLDDQGTASLDRSTLAPIEMPTESQSQGLYRVKEAELYYERTGRRSTLQGGMYIKDRKYVQTQRDERDSGLSLSLSRRLTRQSEGKLYGNVELAEFSGESADYTDYLYGVQMSRRLSRVLRVNADVAHRQRSSSEKATEYDALELVLSLVYQFAP
jgi:hypothetical protein